MPLDLITSIAQVTPAWMERVLRAQGLLPVGTAVAAVRHTASSHIHCLVYHLSVTYIGPATPALPARLFLKLPTTEIDRAGQEAQFYQMLVPAMVAAAPAAAWPFPRCYDVAYAPETGQAHFLLEDLSQTHFTIDGLMAPTNRHAGQVIDAYAQFHAYWWEHPRLGRDIGERPTDDKIDGFIATIQGRSARLVADMGESLSQEDREILQRVVSAWPVRRRQRLVSGQGITLVHRDPHPYNVLYPRDLERGAVKLIDWQSWRVDTGTDDLAYLMACHWLFEARVFIEEMLLRRYHARLAALGVQQYTWEDCWYDYRASVIRCLFFLVFAWSPQQWERIRRGLAAFKHLDCGGLLA